MKTWLCFMLCISMIMGLFMGCSSSLPPSNEPVDQDDAKDRDKLGLEQTNIIYNKSKISSEVVERNSGFAFDLFKQLNKEDQDQNIFISPLSISTALAMTYQGAESTTKEAMAKALGYSGINIESLNESYLNMLRYLRKLDEKIDLNISNSIWIRDGEPIQEDFLSVNKEIFNALVETLDFSKADSADKINEWIYNTTNKKIGKMIEPPIAPDTIMYLINAIYFKGDWAKKFDKNNTFSTPFHTGDGSSRDVMMMSRNGLIEYGQGDDFQAVRLPYGNGKTAMYCILPDGEISINDFIEEMDNHKWEAIKDSISEEDLILQLPRFKLEYGIKSLKGSLTALGMGEAFSDSADFSGIRHELRIDEVLHKAIIDVNEEGSEAAAATVVDMKVTAAAEPISFIADRPFVFIIADDETGSILFMGKVYDLN